MKAELTELVCCRELDARKRQGPCIPIAVPVERLRAVSAPRLLTCDRHNLPIVVVAGARVSAARP